MEVQQRSLSPLAVVGFVLALVVPVAGLAVSIVALVQIRRSAQSGKGFAIAGIVVGVALSVATVVLLFSPFLIPPTAHLHISHG
jgi:cytochrome bd-type quinol oxidase subunit 2